MAYFKVLSWHLPYRTEEEHRIGGIPAKIQTGTSQIHVRHNHLAKPAG
jgi:hypothetical protein